MQIDDNTFERFVMDLLQAMGYGASKDHVQTTQQSRDGGIDGIIKQDKLGIDVIYVQIKHWRTDNLVGRAELQKFVGAIAGASKNSNGRGLFITSSDFTKDAREYADGQRMVLVNGKMLAEMMLEHDFGVSTRKVVKLKSIDSDLFAQYGVEPTRR